MDEKQRFGRSLRALRKQRGLTQEGLAELIDRSVDAISNIERGVSFPSYNTLNRVSEKLGIPFDELQDLLRVKQPKNADPLRSEVEATLDQLVRNMDTALLRVAVEQLQVLVRHLGSGRGK